jgi:hypothetical protein
MSVRHIVNPSLVETCRNRNRPKSDEAEMDDFVFHDA